MWRFVIDVWRFNDPGGDRNRTENQICNMQYKHDDQLCSWCNFVKLIDWDYIADRRAFASQAVSQINVTSSKATLTDVAIVYVNLWWR